ncbi:hypothetical protein EGW08_015571 [Elysia chlorotica]|uniref:tRNA-uridine aminocarboxypropyltransferase 1 n=1 Tax=Elysia chlorotica TaxID=188477 RepID=A0A433T571_ELYCH|nr:hypothetical protein EGW08_015571 [Elysia chlorotica]
MDYNPFPSTVISDWEFLDTVDGRSACPLCGKSRKYFCYTCLIALPQIADRIPKVKLPVTVDIIKHPNEIDGKSTSCHAAVLAPDDVRVFTYPCIPDYDPHKDLASDVAKTENSTSTDLVIGKKRCNEQTLQTGDQTELPSKHPKLSLKVPFEKVVLIDSTWNQTRNIANDERLKNLTKVELKSQNTNFWRHQEGIPSTYLSTIEAIYYFMRDFHLFFLETKYDHEYDNLLFFFCFMYNKIQSSQKKAKKKKD